MSIWIAKFPLCKHNIGWFKHARGRRSTLSSEPEWSYEDGVARDSDEAWKIVRELCDGRSEFSSVRVER